MYVFGVLLLATAGRLARRGGEEPDLRRSRVFRLVQRRLATTDDFHGGRLFVRRGGRRVATPLLAVFILIAATDVAFAIDSIPAIYAVTGEPFIVFAANAFALLGLRALYFALAGLLERFVCLSHTLAILLAFVGAKILLVDVWTFPSWLSLAIIATVLAASIVLSLIAERRRAPDHGSRRATTRSA